MSSSEKTNHFVHKCKRILLIPYIICAALFVFIYNTGRFTISFVYSVGLAVEKLFSYKNLKRVFRLAVTLAVAALDAAGNLRYSFPGILRNFGVALRRTFETLFAFLMRNKAYAISAAACVAFIFGALRINAYAVALKVTIDGRVLGYVSSQQEFEKTVSKVENQVSQNIGESYAMDKTPQFSFAVVDKSSVADTQKLSDAIYSEAVTSLGQTFGLFVDGQLVGACTDEAALKSLLEEIKAPYKTGAANESVEFVKPVEIKLGVYAKSAQKSMQQLTELLKSSTKPMTYTVEKGDTLSGIAQKTGLKTSQLLALNSDVDSELIKPGQKLNVSKPEVYLGVKVIRDITYSENIAYSTVKIDNPDIYKKQTKVKSTGVNGVMSISAKVTYIDGIETGREILKKTTVTEPKNQEIWVGTKALPVTAATGNMMRPVSGYVSDPFGARGGSHAGMDIAGNNRAPIYAADGGTVIFAGRAGDGYGIKVMIDHGNGIVTLYGHCSAIFVSAGDKVYKGQQIAQVGSTGQATGPHLHFEVRVGGRAVNPARYIGG